MRTERVSFFSEGRRIVGLLRLPDDERAAPLPAIVNGPGWLSLAESPATRPFHEGFTAAGNAVLSIDYRGFGESEGDRGWVIPDQQVQDLSNGISYLETRPDVDRRRIGAFGMGGTGGGNAILLAASDERVGCVVAQTVVADGADWLHRMRREHEWIAFLDRVAENRRRRALDGVGETVDPREELMVATPERKVEPSRTDVDRQVGSEFHLATAEFLLRYRPIDVVDRIAPRGLLLACVERDAVTPADHALALYERAGPPKRLIHQRNTTHYRSYRDNYTVLMREFVAWFDAHLVAGAVEAREERASESSIEFLDAPLSSTTGAASVVGGTLV